MNRLTANQTKLYYKTGNESEFTKELSYLMELPELGVVPEKIDVTTLSDDVKKYITGMKDMGDLVFKFLYDNSEETSNFRVLKGFETAGTAASFRVEYPDGTAHVFDAYPFVKMDAGTVNGALTFSCTMALDSDIETENPSA